MAPLRALLAAILPGQALIVPRCTRIARCLPRRVSIMAWSALFTSLWGDGNAIGVVTNTALVACRAILVRVAPSTALVAVRLSRIVLYVTIVTGNARHACCVALHLSCSAIITRFGSLSACKSTGSTV